MQKYFVSKQAIINNNVTIVGNDVHHIKNVMRMKVHDQVLVCDNEQTFLCEIINIDDVVTLQIIKVEEKNNDLKINVTIAQGQLRREKTEEVIRRLTELGCFSYFPVQMKRSIVKVEKDNFESKISRYQKIIKEASEQSQRTKVMEINFPITVNELINMMDNYDLVLVCHVTDECDSLKQLINPNSKNILVIIGPEGGFSDNEIELFKQSNCHFISLGKRILRTETAPLYIMSVIGYEEEI